MARHPFQGIAGQALVGPALPDKSPHFVVAGGALGVLDSLRRFRQFPPGFRRLRAILRQQILAVIEQAGVDEPGHGDQFAVEGVVLHQGGKMLFFDTVGVGFEIDEVLAQNTRPDDVDLEHIDIGGARRQPLLIQG